MAPAQGYPAKVGTGMNTFQTLYDAGAVRRYHTQFMLKDQDIAAHQWGVAMICNRITGGASVHLLLAALMHDLHESEAGDIPYGFKKGTIKEIYDSHEAEFLRRHGVDMAMLEDDERRILKYADMMECLMYCKREVKMGNITVAPIVDTATAALVFMGHPTKAARDLFYEVLNG